MYSCTRFCLIISLLTAICKGKDMERAGQSCEKQGAVQDKKQSGKGLSHPHLFVQWHNHFYPKTPRGTAKHKP